MPIWQHGMRCAYILLGSLSSALGSALHVLRQRRRLDGKGEEARRPAASTFSGRRFVDKRKRTLYTARATYCQPVLASCDVAVHRDAPLTNAL